MKCKAKGIYLCAFRARFPQLDMDYNDIDPKTKADIIGDALKCDLRRYDYILASPPCNYWSRANLNYLTSEYSQRTKHLLPALLALLGHTGKPFILENVRNKPRMSRYHIWGLVSKFGLYVYEVNRHTYFTNRMFNPCLPKMTDFKENGIRLRSAKNGQGGEQVEKVFTQWLLTNGFISENKKKED